MVIASDSIFTKSLLQINKREWCWKWNSDVENISILIPYRYVNVKVFHSCQIFLSLCMQRDSFAVTLRTDLGDYILW